MTSETSDGIEKVVRSGPVGRVTATVERGYLGDQFVMNLRTIMVTHTDDLGTFGRIAYSIGHGSIRCLLRERRGQRSYIAPMIPHDERPGPWIL